MRWAPVALLLVAAAAGAQPPQIATDAAPDDTARPPRRPARLTKLAPYRLDGHGLPPSFVFSQDGSELLYVDARRGALIAAPTAGGRPRVVYAGKVGHVEPQLEAGDALVQIDERFETQDNVYSEHFRRVVVATGASTELGRELPAEQRMLQDSARFRAAGTPGVQPFRAGALLGGQTPDKDLVVLDGGRVITVCRSPGRDVAWPHPLGDGHRLAQPAGADLYLADLAARTCIRTDQALGASSFVYPTLAGTTDGRWVLFAAYRAPRTSGTERELRLYLADASGHTALVAELPGAIGVRPVAVPGAHRFVYAVSWPAAPHAYRTVFYELDANTGVSERRTCALTTTTEASTAPDFQLSPDGHTLAVAVAEPGGCGVTGAGIYALEL